MARSNSGSLLRLHDFVGIEEGKFVFRKRSEGKSLTVRKDLKIFLHLASGALFLSGLMDMILWFTTRYMVPCWTVALMSVATGAITLSLTYARIFFSRKSSS